MLPATKMMQRIAFLIMLHSVYVESIRNGGSSQNNYDSNPALAATTQSSFFPAHQPTETMIEARQSTPFRPSQLLQFTTSDASDAAFASTQNYPLYASDSVNAKYPEAVETRFSQSDSPFAFPSESKQEQTAFTATNKYNNYNNNNNNYNSNYNNKYNYNTNPQPYRPNAIPTQLQSTPILTYLDPYTNENYQSAGGGDSGGVQEFTVHSSLLVQPHGHGPSAPTYQREPSSASSYQQPSYAIRPSYATQPLNAFAHKYDDIRPHYSQHPNALPNYERELPGPAAPARLSYASKDYPPPSYLQHSNQSPPQRQDFSTASSAVSPNYANSNNFNNNNNLGNYVQVAQQQQQQQLPSGNYQARPPPSYASTQYPPVRPNYQPTRGGPPQPPRPSYNNYYSYQQGEIPPTYTQLGYRPGPPLYRPLQQASPQTSGLSSLATLFTNTQQYAPQFTNLLLNGVAGGVGGGNNNGLTSLLGAFAGGNGASLPTRPINVQLIKALENIARNDDLQCVPKVLCQMIAGQTQRGQLPTFATSPAITNFLSAIPTASPALIYGRAALLGISGGVKSCQGTYSKCPKTEDEILYYLNNHRGGFFKLFSEPELEPEQPQQSMSSSSSSSSSPSSGSSSLFGILSLLTGNPPPTTTTPRPTPRPTTASADITSGIGNFFTNVLSEYLGGVEYQRRRRRRSLDASNDKQDIQAELEQETDAEDFHDEEDSADTQGEPDDYEDIDGRILHKDILAGSERGPKFFPENLEEIRNNFDAYNQEAASKKLKFPSSTADEEYEAAQVLNNKRRGKQLPLAEENRIENESATQYTNFKESSSEEQADEGKIVRFVDEPEDDLHASHTNLNPIRGGKMIFPDHYETHIRKGKILNHPTYAAEYVSYEDQDRLVVSDDKRRPYYEASSSTSNNNYYAPSSNSKISNTNRYSNLQYQGTDNNNNYNNYYNNNKASNHNYNYPNNNYLANNRYHSSNYQNVVRTTRRPYEDDKNIYITNSKGMNEYYITPDGRKIYL